MKSDKFNLLIDGLQRASLEDECWERWTNQAVDVFGAHGGSFLVFDTEEGRLKRHHEFHRNIDCAALAAEYDSGPYLWDPALDRVAKCIAPEIFSDALDKEASNPLHRAFTDWLQSWGVGLHHTTTTLPVGPVLRATFCLHWGPDHGPSRAQEVHDLAAIVPHLDDALRFGFEHQQVLQHSWWEGQRGRSETDAVALVDERGFVVRMSPAFERVVRRGGWIEVSRNWLRARDAYADRVLQSALFRATSGLEARTVSLSIPQSPRYSAKLDVKPVAREHRYLVPHEAAALLRLELRAFRQPHPEQR